MGFRRKGNSKSYWKELGLSWYEYPIYFLPLGLAALGGGLGGLCGGLAVAVNLKIAASKMPKIVKYLFALVLTAIAGAAWWWAVIVITEIIDARAS